MAVLRATAAEAMAHVDLLVVLPLTARDGITAPDDEDPALRDAMDARLLELCEDDELVGPVGQLLEVAGSPGSRLAQVLAAVAGGGAG